jgi:hypothetical protein
VLDGDRGKNGVHHQRAGRLAFANQASEDVPMQIAGLQNASRRLASQDYTAASASAAESGRSKTRVLVEFLRSAHRGQPCEANRRRFASTSSARIAAGAPVRASENGIGDLHLSSKTC